MFLLDTNVVSELRRPDKANPSVVRWASSIPVTQFYLSVITILELELGALQIARKDTRQGAVLRTWIDSQILPQFEGRILPIDTVIAQRCAMLHIPDPRSERDSLIAATALLHSMRLVTRNEADFVTTGVLLINPWG